MPPDTHRQALVRPLLTVAILALGALGWRLLCPVQTPLAHTSTRWAVTQCRFDPAVFQRGTGESTALLLAWCPCLPSSSGSTLCP